MKATLAWCDAADLHGAGWVPRAQVRVVSSQVLCAAWRLARSAIYYGWATPERLLAWLAVHERCPRSLITAI